YCLHGIIFFFLSIINQGELGNLQQDLPEHNDSFSLFADVYHSQPLRNPDLQKSFQRSS
ncbi:hypothetical protein ABG768_008071, partial [Culter alburnus]